MTIVIDEGKMMKPVQSFAAIILLAITALVLLDLQLSALWRALFELITFILLWQGFICWQQRGIRSSDRNAKH
ncbi:hypothetical protein [Shewanella dokdonensis]|uniref:Uncharacterized protein n=1 Tax=Shewanella dokdonensis TaxID=712036 RepID=A0ABX8DIF8_9GAMM|nr:hypothetical protein [Shewanella dokdonensis]MCL1076163.1 hypothetical protein [Shewanella dokdonensis]QVK24451.1 hypothetical protein KHX94_08270 [Shewanella dokdonensis]